MAGVCTPALHTASRPSTPKERHASCAEGCSNLLLNKLCKLGLCMHAVGSGAHHPFRPMRHAEASVLARQPIAGCQIASLAFLVIHINLHEHV